MLELTMRGPQQTHTAAGLRETARPQLAAISRQQDFRAPEEQAERMRKANTSMWFHRLPADQRRLIDIAQGGAKAGQ